MARSRIHALKILIAPDSFKGSLSAAEAADAIHRGVREVLPDALVARAPVSDGGDGLLDVVGRAVAGTMMTCTVHGPLPDQMVPARWFHARDGSAVLEMAEAAGLMLIPPDRRGPKITTTFGVGEMIRNALASGVQRAIIGLGGSGTIDGGAGMAQALGIRFLDRTGAPLPQGGASLKNLDRIVMENIDQRVRGVQWIAACDVTNPLCGTQGAAHVYGPQKGATTDDIRLLDEALDHYASVLERDCGVSVRDLPGAGAAGGFGAGLAALCGAAIQPGIDVVLDIIGFDKLLLNTDIVITGEGMLDAQTRFGKAVAGVVRRARRHGKQVLGVFGQIDLPLQEREEMFLQVASIVNDTTDAETAMRQAGMLLQERTTTMLQNYLGSGE